MVLRRSRRSRRSAGDEGPEDRSYGIWGLAAMFTVLALGGLFALLFLEGSDESVQLPTPQTMPDGYEEDPTAVEQPDGTDDGQPQAGPPVFPDGSPAPEGVSAITVADGTTSLTFDPPAGRTDAEGDPVGDLDAEIAPATVTVAAEESALVVRVECARSAEEFLAQLTVTEAVVSVTVAAVVLVPPDGPPCPAEGASTVVTVPLLEPLDGRTVNVLPAGTPVGES